MDLLSREEDLGLYSLSSSMDSLKESVKKMDDSKKYDLIYTQDWSIAFPLIIPLKCLFEKHFCFFHNIEKTGKSKIFQKIVGNIMGEKLVVRTKELKEKFPLSSLSENGLNIIKHNK